MSTAIVKQGFNQEQIALIKSTIMAGKTPPSDNELALFGMICQRAGLDPFAKQVYAIQRYDKANKAYKWTFQISVDGLRAIADRTGQYAGSDEPLFDEGLDCFSFEQTGRTLPSICKVTVWKMIGGQRCPFVGIAKYSEFVQTYEGKPSGLWQNMPLTMLAKCAESQALRKAFPQCNSLLPEASTTEPIVETEPLQDPDQWRIDGYEWALQQGIDPNDATEICKIAKDKLDLLQRLKSAIPVAEVVG
jgi:phage recombination protein Bet